MENRMEKLVSLAKRRGFVYQGSEIYGGLSGMWDYGPMGVLLKNNIKALWWSMFVKKRGDIYGLDSAILMHQDAWKASGHVDGFADPVVECSNCGKKFRGDHVAGGRCQICGGALKEKGSFNMMFKTNVGATENSSSVAYLRPETAGGIFLNYKNVIDSFHPKIPFGIAQIGKAFRNEISARDFLFRAREFEQMEIEWFIKVKNDNDWENEFGKWRENILEFLDKIGIDKNKTSESDVPKEDLAHYSKRTVDFEYNYPFGKAELLGLAYRGEFDLKSHQDMSGIDMLYYEQESGEKFLPHVIEPSFGLDRMFFALLDSVYKEEEIAGEKRVVLKFKKAVAPITVAILPLMKKDDLKEKAENIHKFLLENSDWLVVYDETGSIGKRYRRQDEVGTPYCITVDYDTLKDETVTVRDRDTMEQERIKINDLLEFFNKNLK